MVNPDKILRKKHIYYYVEKDGSGFVSGLVLKKVVEVYYQHPDGPIEIPRIETHEILRTDFLKNEHPEVFLLYNQQNVVRNINKVV